jgi:hypothetical protein
MFYDFWVHFEGKMFLDIKYLCLLIRTLHDKQWWSIIKHNQHGFHENDKIAHLFPKLLLTVPQNHDKKSYLQMSFKSFFVHFFEKNALLFSLCLPSDRPLKIITLKLVRLVTSFFYRIKAQDPRMIYVINSKVKIWQNR